MLDGGGHVAIRWSTAGRIEVRCGRALVTVAPQSVSVTDAEALLQATQRPSWRPWRHP